MGKLRNIVRFAALTSPCFWGKLQNIVRSAALTSPCRGSCKTSVSACLLASPCLWGKLQNLSLVSSFCFSSGVTVSMGEAAKHRSFCCAHVAVSLGEAAKPQSLLVFWRLRVYGGSCRTSVSSRVSASPLASPCLWGKLQNIVRSAALTSPCRGSCKTSVFCLLASPCLWGKLQNFSLVSSFCFSSGVSVSMGEAAKHRSFCWSCKTSVSSRVSASPLASPCLWGKLQNIVRFAALTSRCLWGKLQNLSLCLSSGVSVPMGEAARHRSFCCAHVAVSLGEAAKHQSLLVFWRLASPCLWGKLQNIVRFAALSEGMWKPISCLFWTRPSLWVMRINGIVDILWSTSIHLLPIESVGASLHLLLQLLPIVACTQSTARSQLANLRRTNHYLILDRYGQIDSCSHDIVDMRPTGCLVNACDLLFYLFHPFSDPSCQRTSPALSAQSRKATLLASIFQHLSTACLLFLAFFYEKGRIRFKMKKINLARGWEDTPPGLDRAAKFADMACELSWDPIGCATGCLQLQWERL